MNSSRFYKKVEVALIFMMATASMYIALFLITHQYIEFRNNSRIVSIWVVRGWVHPKCHDLIDACYSRARKLVYDMGTDK
jgi:hypothetical protein